jgi:hypothetical protein
LCKLSNGALKNISHNIRPETLDKILNAFPDINGKWLLYNDGDMLIKTLSKNNPCDEIGLNLDMINESEFGDPEKLKQAIHLMKVLLNDRQHEIDRLKNELLSAKDKIIQLQQSLNVKSLEAINKQT